MSGLVFSFTHHLCHVFLRQKKWLNPSSPYRWDIHTCGDRIRNVLFNHCMPFQYCTRLVFLYQPTTRVLSLTHHRKVKTLMRKVLQKNVEGGIFLKSVHSHLKDYVLFFCQTKPHGKYPFTSSKQDTHSEGSLKGDGRRKSFQVFRQPLERFLLIFIKHNHEW